MRLRQRIVLQNATPPLRGLLQLETLYAFTVFYTVYEAYREGKLLPDDQVQASKVTGTIEYGTGGTSRYPCKTATVVGPDGTPLLAELEYYSGTPHDNGRLIIAGRQRAAHQNGLHWQKVPYRQVWLCFPVKG